MPLIKSKSSKAVGKNIAAEENAGKDPKQAIAIAMEIQRRAKGYADGGEVEKQPLSYNGGTKEEQDQRAKDAQAGFMKAVNDNPISKLLGLSEGGKVPNFDSESSHSVHKILGMIVGQLRKKKS